MLVSSKTNLRPAGVCFDKVGEWQDAGNRVKIILLEYPRHLFFDLLEHIGNRDPGFPDIIIACSTGKCDRLEVHTPDHGYVTRGKTDDVADLVIISAPDNGRDKDNAEPDPL